MKFPCPSTTNTILGGKKELVAYPEDEALKMSRKFENLSEKDRNIRSPRGQPGLRLEWAGHNDLTCVLPTLPADGGLKPRKIRNEWHGWRQLSNMKTPFGILFIPKL